MIYRLFLSCIIIVLCYICGRNYSLRYIVRERNIKIFCDSLRQLIFNIRFLNMPLWESFLNISRNEKNVVGDFFAYVSNGMKCKNESYSLWKDALEFYKDELMFQDKEIEILRDLSKRLGTGEKNNEINNIECTVLRLENVGEEAFDERRSNVKVFRGLGALAGIFIVVLLI